MEGNKRLRIKRSLKYLALFMLLAAGGVFLCWLSPLWRTEARLIGTWAGVNDKGLMDVYTFNPDGIYYYYQISLAVLEASASRPSQGVFYVDKNVLSFYPGSAAFKIRFLSKDIMMWENLPKNCYIALHRIKPQNAENFIKDEKKASNLEAEKEARIEKDNKLSNQDGTKDLKTRVLNAYYPFDMGRRQLVNGCCQYVEPDTSTGILRENVLIAEAEEVMGFGDINNDGFTDAVVVLNENYGGNACFPNIYAYFDYGSGQYETVPVDELFMNSRVLRINVSGSEITVNYLTMASGQSKIDDPKLFVSATYVFKNGKFAQEEEISRDLRFQ